MTKKYKRLSILIPVIILTVVGGLFIYPRVDRYLKQRPIKEANILRNEIVSSIRNPFAQADTLILETRWMFCGNSDPDELPFVFETQLDEENYRQLLTQQINKPVLTMTEFNNVMDTVRFVRFNGDYPSSLWDTCRVGKVSADITAEQLSPQRVRLYEKYLYDDTAKYFRKEFAFDGNKWTYAITDTSSKVITK